MKEPYGKYRVRVSYHYDQKVLCSILNLVRIYICVNDNKVTPT